MSLSINTDTMSVVAQRSLHNSAKSVAKSMGHLSTGTKVTSASDNAANLSLSTSINAKRSGVNVGTTNIQTAITKLQTFEGYLENMSESLQKVRELSIESANGVYSAKERAMIDAHAQGLKEEILTATKIANSELGANLNDFSVQTGENADTASRIDFGDVELDFTGLLDIDLNTADDSRLTIEEVDKALEYIAGERASLGSFMTEMEGALTTNGTRENNLAASFSTLYDADMALESSNLAKDQIIQNSAVSMLQQSKNIRSSAILGLY